MKYLNALLGGLLALSAGSLMAADSYDTSNSILTIPQVKVGTTMYKNVSVLLGAVVSSGSTVDPAADTYSTYDTSTNRLTIPVVTVGTSTYYNAVATLANVLSVGSSCLIGSTCTTTATPEVKGVIPGDSRISVMFNFMGGKITTALGSSSTYVPATAYVALCRSTDGGTTGMSTSSGEYTASLANITNPLVVSGLTNGKTYTCTVTASSTGSIATTSASSTSAIPNSGPATASGVLSSTVNTSHLAAYAAYNSYCNYTNETATGLSTPATISYYNTSGVLTTGTSKSTITCNGTSTRTITANALPDHKASDFFTSGLTGYTNPPYVSGNPNSIGEKAVSKQVPFSGTISTLYSKGTASYDTSPCYTYTSSTTPSVSANNKWVSGPAVWSSGTVRCNWVAFPSYLNNGVKVEAGTAEVYTATNIFNIAGKNLYQDVGLDPSNAHNQPTVSGGSTKKYGYYHVHGVPEGYVARLGKGNATMTLVGFAVDGFPIYARYGYSNASSISGGLKIMKGNYRLRTTAELTAAGYSDRPANSVIPFGVFEQDWVYDATSSSSPNGDLDACNGRYGVTPESPTTAVYHYFITDSYPYVQRCVFGALPTGTWANDGSAN
jgi:hypothetical protein